MIPKDSIWWKGREGWVDVAKGYEEQQVFEETGQQT